VNVDLPYGETTLTATLPERTRVFSNSEAVVPDARQRPDDGRRRGVGAHRSACHVSASW
jgi:hypothetical protein